MLCMSQTSERTESVLYVLFVDYYLFNYRLPVLCPAARLSILLTCVLANPYFVFLCLYAISEMTVNACSWPGDVFCAFLFLYAVNEQHSLVHFKIILGTHLFCKVLAFSSIVQSSLYILKGS